VVELLGRAMRLWCVTQQATSSVNSAHALPVLMTLLRWYAMLQAMQKANALYALPVLVALLL
jgi:hypothetical protein